MTPRFNIVLIEPEIPNNTGNVGRTCIGGSANLHLVGKLGFEIDDRKLKRAGLDYWKYLEWYHHKTWEDWWDVIPDKSRVFFFTKKTDKTIYHSKFKNGDWLVFGKETKGLPDEVLKKFDAQTLSIPMYGPVRSLNLANAVAVVLYEALRQVSFAPSERVE